MSIPTEPTAYCEAILYGINQRVHDLGPFADFAAWTLDHFQRMQDGDVLRSCLNEGEEAGVFWATEAERIGRLLNSSTTFAALVAYSEACWNRDIPEAVYDAAWQGVWTATEDLDTDDDDNQLDSADFNDEADGLRN